MLTFCVDKASSVGVVVLTPENLQCYPCLGQYAARCLIPGNKHDVILFLRINIKTETFLLPFPEVLYEHKSLHKQ